MNDDYAMEMASRFGDIPFVEFTAGLVTGVFDSLVDAHILQMEEYASFVNSLTQDLSTYINNTQDGVTFDQVSDFVLNYELPEVNVSELTTQLALLEAPSVSTPTVPATSSNPSTTETWWGGLINALSPAVTALVDKIKDPSENLQFQAFVDYNQAVLDGVALTAANIPTYQNIQNAIAALIVSNKYGLLKSVVNQGMMRLVVTEGEIETKLTFSTYNTSASGNSTGHKQKIKDKVKSNKKSSGGIFPLFKAKKKYKSVNKTITVNSAQSYQRDSSGTSVNVFGRVLIKFKTDYAPLNQ